MLHPRHQPLFDLLRSPLPLDPRKLHVFTALILSMIQARTVVLYQLVPHLQLSGTQDSRYKRLKRFVQSDLSDLLVARLVLRHLNPGKIYLVIDRTHWQLGQHHINVLLISAVWHSFAFPLCWTVLDHAGNSTASNC